MTEAFTICARRWNRYSLDWVCNHAVGFATACNRRKGLPLLPQYEVCGFANLVVEGKLAIIPKTYLSCLRQIVSINLQ